MYFQCQRNFHKAHFPFAGRTAWEIPLRGLAADWCKCTAPPAGIPKFRAECELRVSSRGEAETQQVQSEMMKSSARCLHKLGEAGMYWKLWVKCPKTAEQSPCKVHTLIPPVSLTLAHLPILRMLQARGSQFGLSQAKHLSNLSFQLVLQKFFSLCKTIGSYSTCFKGTMCKKIGFLWAKRKRNKYCFNKYISCKITRRKLRTGSL